MIMSVRGRFDVMPCDEGHDDDHNDHDDYKGEGALSEGCSGRFAQDAHIIRLRLHRRFDTATFTNIRTTNAESEDCFRLGQDIHSAFSTSSTHIFQTSFMQFLACISFGCFMIYIVVLQIA